ncbi:MAG: class I tRNA ligase family protein, partial [Paraglaciecola chathamensis]
RFDIAANLVYEFTWNQFCDWYLELSKPVLNSEVSTEAQKRGTRHTLVNVLESILRLAHPIMPFITEEIWQRVAPLCGIQANSIMTQPFPVQNEALRDEDTLAEMEWIKSVIVGIRNIRGEMDISPNKPLNVLLRNASAQDWQRLQSSREFLGALAKLESVELLQPEEEAPASATALVGEMEILIPMAGLIDKDAELARINRALAKIEADFGRTQGKLNNEKFVSNAPPAVIDKEKAKLEDFSMQMKKLKEQKETIENL